MTAFEWHAQQIEMAAKALSHFFLTTEPGRRTWCPPGENGGEGRSAIAQMSEVARACNGAAARLRGETPPEPVEFTTEEQAQDAADAVIAAGKAYADAVRSCTEDVLEKEFEMPWGATWNGTLMLTFPFGNIHYHMGQINYIQTLYGDKEFHVEGLI